MSKNKTNPKKIPRTEADVKRAFRDGKAIGVEIARVVFLWAAKDMGATNPEVLAYWDRVQAMSDSMNLGYVSLWDAKKTLEEEYDMYFEHIDKYKP